MTVSEQNTLKQKSWIDSHTKREVVLLSDVRKWLQRKPQEFREFMTISKDENDLIEEFVRRLLEDLDK